MTQAGVEKSSTAPPRPLDEELDRDGRERRGSTRSLLITSTPLSVGLLHPIEAEAGFASSAKQPALSKSP